MAGERVLIVDDDPRVLDLLNVYLKNAGYSPIMASDGESALIERRRQHPALVILDVMMPKMDGWTVCRKMRQESSVPIIMLTAKDDEVDKILGLELGADDYVTKPFSPREITARVKAVLRRVTSDDGSQANYFLEWAGLSIDPLGRSVVVRGEEVSLAPKEFDLLWHMARHPGQAFSREQLYESVWGFDYYGGVRTVDVHITRLRNKVEQDPKEPKLLKTVWGVGYKFEEP